MNPDGRWLMCTYGVGPQWCLPTVPANILAGLKGAGVIDVVEVPFGCYLFTSDGSERGGFIDYRNSRAPAQTVDGIAAWLMSASLPVRLVDRFVHKGTAPPPLATSRPATAEPKAPKRPKGVHPDQMSLF